MSNRAFVFAAFLAFVVLGVQFAHGQSGRRTKPTPAPSASQPAPAAPKSEDGTEPIDPKIVSNITSLLVAGEMVHDYWYYRSSELDSALKECVKRFRSGLMIVDAAKIGKLSYEGAKERAKKETTAHVLWISFMSSDDGYGNMRIEYADYAVLMPTTGARLTHGRVRPDKRSVIATGGVLGLPPPGRPRSSPAAVRREMQMIARHIPEILVNGGWFGR